MCRNRSKSDTIIMCPKCFHFAPREGHHVYPREFHGRQPNGPLLYLCEVCHQKIQAIVHFEHLSPEQIYDLTVEWLAGE